MAFGTALTSSLTGGPFNSLLPFFAGALALRASTSGRFASRPTRAAQPLSELPDSRVAESAARSASPSRGPTPGYVRDMTVDLTPRSLLDRPVSRHWFTPPRESRSWPQSVCPHIIRVFGAMKSGSVNEHRGSVLLKAEENEQVFRLIGNRCQVSCDTPLLRFCKCDFQGCGGLTLSSDEFNARLVCRRFWCHLIQGRWLFGKKCESRLWCRGTAAFARLSFRLVKMLLFLVL